MNSNSSSSAPPPIRLTRIAQIVIALVIIGLLIGFVPRWISQRKLVKETHAESVINVNVISPTPSKPDLGTPLPAEVQAFVQASIHARASGYLKNWFVDIGDHVTNGQVLAEIDTPELVQQLAQAKAELDQAKAALDLAKTTADRWTELLKTASVSEQETAEKTADYTLKQANVEATRANVQRLEDLRNFDRVTAPFDGTITARNTDIGQLSYSADGKTFSPLGEKIPMPYQLKTFQGIRYSLFHYNAYGAPGGHADFDQFTVDEPRPRGLTRPIPVGKSITLTSLGDGAALTVKDGVVQTTTAEKTATAFKVVDRDLGRIALETPAGRFVSVGGTGNAGEITIKTGKPGDAETFQWVDMQRDDLMLLSLATHRFLVVAADKPGPAAANLSGPRPNRKDGSCFAWKLAAN